MAVGCCHHPISCAELAEGGGVSPIVLTVCMLVKYVAGCSSLVVYQLCISVEFVYGLVQPPEVS